MTSCSGFCVLCGSRTLGQSRGFPEKEPRTERDGVRMGPQGGPLHRRMGSVIQRARGGGQPMEGALRKRMSTCLNHDFRDVRVHTGPEANELSHQLGASAFTVGSDIFFAKGAYDPTSRCGQELIAHELVHVAQQRQGASGGASSGVIVSSADDLLEHEATSLAARAVSQPLARADRRGITVHLRTEHPWMVLRALSDECQTAAPMNIPCHTVTLWWIYRTIHPTTRDQAGFGEFVDALKGRPASGLIANLIKNHGKKKSPEQGKYVAQVGTVVVFAKSTKLDAVGKGHSCVCGGGNELYGHNQGGWFSSCDHGVIGLHCHHGGGDIAQKKGFNLYEVDSGSVAKWAAKNL